MQISSTSASSLANNALHIAQNILRWDEERYALALLPSLNHEQKKRMADLNSAIDLYSTCLEDIGEVPVSACIDRLN